MCCQKRSWYESDTERVRDILEAIERIQRYTAAGRQSFEVSELVQAWVVHHLEIVGEAACRLSDEWRRDHPDVPVRGIVGMRNALAHGYFEIDAVAVWNVVERDLPCSPDVFRASRSLLVMTPAKMIGRRGRSTQICAGGCRH